MTSEDSTREYSRTAKVENNLTKMNVAAEWNECGACMQHVRVEIWVPYITSSTTASKTISLPVQHPVFHHNLATFVVTRHIIFTSCVPTLSILCIILTCNQLLPTRLPFDVRFVSSHFFVIPFGYFTTPKVLNPHRLIDTVHLQYLHLYVFRLVLSFLVNFTPTHFQPTIA